MMSGDDYFYKRLDVCVNCALPSNAHMNDPQNPLRLVCPTKPGYDHSKDALPYVSKNLLEARKDDDSKTRMDLLPFAAVEKVAEVFSYGAKKYADHNYRKGMRHGRLLAAALRHLFAWARNQDTDDESGHNHLAHACCCILMLLDAQIHGLGTDDRWGRT
jgi:hypothetical protein